MNIEIFTKERVVKGYLVGSYEEALNYLCCHGNGLYITGEYQRGASNTLGTSPAPLGYFLDAVNTARIIHNDNFRSRRVGLLIKERT